MSRHHKPEENGPRRKASKPGFIAMPRSETSPAALVKRLFQPVSVESMAVFRMAFGAILIWEVFRYFAADRIRRFYVEPQFLFTYYGFDWVHPWPAIGMNLHFVLLGGLALLILLGLFYRVSAGLFFLGFTYVFLLDQSRYLNHFYLVCLISLLMTVVPAHGLWSMDRRLGWTSRTGTAPAWTLWFLRAQIGVVYFFGGIAKFNGDWLRGEPVRDWLSDRSGMPVLGPLLATEATVWIFAYGGLLFDLLVVPALLWRRTRPWAFGVAVLFHLTNAVVFRIGIFPWFMIAATTLFFAPDWPGRFLGRKRDSKVTPSANMAESRRQRLLVLWLGGAYLAVQLLVPLRHLLYPGNVHWTEEGHRFSWRMKLRSKQGEVQYFVTDPTKGDTRTVNPGTYLTPSQLDEMATRPDMILQFAHHLADEARRAGSSNVQVRVMARVSLNGRVPHLLIDPSVDLAAVPRSLAHAPWIMPLGESLRREPSTPP